MSQPTTPTGYGDHDRAWNQGDYSHSNNRADCNACHFLARVEAEARNELLTEMVKQLNHWEATGELLFEPWMKARAALAATEAPAGSERDRWGRTAEGIAFQQMMDEGESL